MLNQWIQEGLKDVLPMIEEFSPMIASILGSPMAGWAISILASHFGVNVTDISGLGKMMANNSDLPSALSSVQSNNIDFLSKLPIITQPTKIRVNIEADWSK